MNTCTPAKAIQVAKNLPRALPSVNCPELMNELQVPVGLGGSVKPQQCILNACGDPCSTADFLH